MKFLLVSNGELAREMYRSMQGFYSEPDVDVLCLHMDKDSFVYELQAYMRSSDEETLIVCDAFGSTAFNEAIYLVHRYSLKNRIGILCGMNLPMVFKLYGLKDQWNIQNIMSLYEDEQGTWGNGDLYYAHAV